MNELVLATLDLTNETLTATIVIVSVSILLYNLSRRTQDRVMRASAAVLACVVFTYLADLFVSLEPGDKYLELGLRIQWLGIAFIPAALFHLSDALLATTGRPSRGRRKFVVRLSYGISAIFTCLALFTDILVTKPDLAELPRMRPNWVFPIYMAYLLVVGLVAVINVVRARRRCLTRYTRRRMTYLLAVFLSPVYGVFPYTLLFDQISDEKSAPLLVILNLANLTVMLMLIFMAYPLSFFGSEKPDRVIKSQLLEFMLRGPLTAAAILAAILFVPRVSNVLGLDGNAFMPFAAVTILLLLQWSITQLLPVFQRWLVYTDDQPRAQWIQKIGERLLTRSDAEQLLESILAAICDHLRVSTAFVARFESNGPELVQVVGPLVPSPEALLSPELTSLSGEDTHTLKRVGNFFLWRSYWLVPLYHHNTRVLVGVLGIWARSPEPDLVEDEEDLFHSLVRQAAQVLGDLQRQAEVFLLLEGLASEMDVMQQLRGVSRYGHISSLPVPTNELVSDPRFSDFVKDALRDYWGGPKLTESELLQLNIVWQEMEQGDNANPVRALRNVLAQAIENLKPEGQRSLTGAEWILYNILEMRFVQGRKVRDVALKLAMSESDLYRKQRIAIEEVARQIEEMERTVVAAHQPDPNGTRQPVPSPLEDKITTE